MEVTNLYTARVQMVEAMEQGLPWHEAAKRAGLQISQSTAYRLRQRLRQGGEQALREGRHGHPVKLRGEVRHWLEQTCRQAPSTPSHEIQTQLAHQFSLQVSVSQINRTRATLGVSNPVLATWHIRSKKEGFGLPFFVFLVIFLAGSHI